MTSELIETLIDQICDALEMFTVTPTDDQTLSDIQNTIDAILIAGQDNGHVTSYDTAIVADPKENTVEIAVNVDFGDNEQIILTGSFVVSNKEDDGYVQFNNRALAAVNEWYDDVMKVVQ